MDDLINSKDYWDNRFEENWKENMGRQQTEFFAKLMIDLMPEWLVRDIRKYEYTICDMGCALGDGVDTLSKFLGVNLDGADFSEVAIQSARKYYPQYNFFQLDLTNISNNLLYDILICSNVLEHFSNPWEIMNNMVKIAQKYIILMVPYQEKMIIDEHEYKFDSNVIPVNIEKFSLIYCDTIDAGRVEDTYYSDPQILLVYSNNPRDKDICKLSDICEKTNIELQNKILDLQKEIQEKSIQISNKQEVIDTENSINIKLKSECEMLVNTINDKAEEMRECQVRLEDITKQLDGKNNQLQQKENDFMLLKDKMNYIENEYLVAKNIIYDYQMQIISLERSLSWRITKPIRFISKRLGISKMHQYLRIKKNQNNSAKIGKNIYCRLKKSRYLPIIKKIVPARLRYKVSNRYYSPEVNNNLDYNNSILQQLSEFVHNIKGDEKLLLVFSGVKYIDSEGQRNIRLVHEALKKGIKVVFAYWRWDVNEVVQNNLDNMFQIPIDILYASRVDIFENILRIKSDKTLLIEFPHEYASEIVDIANCFGWTTIYDVIDDWEEFSKCGQAVWFNKNCELKIANSVDINIATATRLKEKISNELYNKNNYHIITNGVDPNKIKKSNKIKEYNYSRGDLQIGYFGHLTESWFDWKLVKELAIKHNEWTFHIIGYGEPDNLVLPNNIIMYGKQEPSELSKYAAYWDVAIIPFINCELTLSVNPIKIYEYLQLGLPTVASNMIEIKDFPYTQITENNNEFEQAIIKAATMTVDDKIVDEFVMNNTWETKFNRMIECIEEFKSYNSYKIIFKEEENNQ